MRTVARSWGIQHMSEQAGLEECLVKPIFSECLVASGSFNRRSVT